MVLGYVQRLECRSRAINISTTLSLILYNAMWFHVCAISDEERESWKDIPDGLMNAYQRNMIKSDDLLYKLTAPHRRKRNDSIFS